MFLIFAIGLVSLTSLLFYVTAWDKRPVTVALLRERIWDLLEWIGAFGCFLIANVLLGLIIIIIVRSFTSHFISTYDLNNPLLLVFSAAQGFVFQLWWKRK